MTKTILITGSTDGIGKLAAIKLAKKGHKLFLHGRNTEKLAAVIQEVKTQSNNENIGGFVSDFSDLDQVRRMADEVKNRVSEIDVLINNAGILKSDQSLNKDGKDIRIIVNYLAPYILTNAIIPILKNTKDPQIINLSSAAQTSVSDDLLRGKVQVSANESYAQSKLAILMWSFYLSKKESGISTIALNPGSLLNTNMVREAYGKFWSPADKGGDIIFDLVESNEFKDITGKYFDNDKGAFNEAHSDAYDDEKIEKLIKTTDELVG